MNENMTNLEKYRKIAELTQEELAEKSTVKLSRIRSWEQRQRNINNGRARDVIMIAETLKIQPVQLMES